MQLPNVNANLKFTAKLPDGKPVVFRPFLASEEKLFLVAKESEDLGSILTALWGVIEACVFTKLDVGSLKMHDLAYLFVQIRAKSVGEQDVFTIPCKVCGGENKVAFNYETDVTVKDGVIYDMISLSDQYSLSVSAPSVAQVIDLQSSNPQNLEKAILCACLNTLHDLSSGEKYAMQEYSLEDKIAFIENLSFPQLEALQKFFQNLPQIQSAIHFDCADCGAPNDVEVEGLANFFGSESPIAA